MKYKKGDKVRLNEEGEKKVCSEAKRDILKYGKDGVFTIKNEHPLWKKIFAKDLTKTADTRYLAEEFPFDWAWSEENIEKIKDTDMINNRFEILDL